MIVVIITTKLPLMPSILTCELFCILLLDYKGMLPKYNINNARFIGLEICAEGKKVLCLPPELSGVYF
jgi:hypothetical protein